MRLKQEENGRYREIGKNHIVPVKEIINIIKDGVDITLMDHQGYDITKEFLIKHALGVSMFKTNSDGECWLLEFLSRELDEEVFYNVLRSGGLGNYILRRA